MIEYEKRKSIGNKIKKLREIKGWSRKELAQKMNLSENSIKDIESGRNKLNNVKQVDKILNLFDITFDFLFQDVLIAFQKDKDKSDFQKNIDFLLHQMDIETLDIVDLILNAIIEYQKKVKNS